MVISGVNTVTYNGDGITTAWPYTYEVTDASEIRIQLNNADGTAVIVESDYYVDLINSTVYYPGYAPGSEPPEAEQPPKVQTGQTITVYREIPMTQESDLGEKWPFEVIEKGLDKLTMIAQQIDSGTKRTIDNALASMEMLADVVVDSDELQHITDQLNSIDANAAAALDSENSAIASATAAANSATAAATTEAALVNFLATKETITAPAVDTTLTVTGAAADAKVTGEKITQNIYDNVKLANGNILRTFAKYTSRTVNGVTFTWNNDNTKCTVTGTSTGTSICNLYGASEDFPALLTPGKSYFLQFTTTDENIGIEVFIKRTTTTSTFYNSDAIIDIPSDAVGIGLRLRVVDGSTVNGVVELIGITEIYNRKALSELLRKNVPTTMSLFGIKDLLWDYTNPVNNIANGVTKIVDIVNKTITLSGTATANTILNFYLDNNNFPSWLEKGKVYYAHCYSDTNVRFEVQEYVPDEEISQLICSVSNGVKSFKFSDDAHGALIRLYIPSGTETNITISPFISETRTLKELDAKFEKYELEDTGFELYTEFIREDMWWNNNGGLISSRPDLKHCSPIRIRPNTQYFQGYKILGNTCYGAFFDKEGNWIAPLKDEDFIEYSYKTPNGDPTSSLTNYVKLYTFTSPAGAYYFSYNMALDSSAGYPYRNYVASKPLFMLSNTGNYIINKNDALYQRYKDKKLCVFGASAVMIDRLFRDGSNNDFNQYVVGWQEYLYPYFDTVDSYGYSSASWRKYDVEDGASVRSIYSRIVTDQLDLSGYDVYILCASGNALTASTIGSVSSPSDLGDVGTYVGAMRQVIDYIYSQNPLAEIYVTNLTSTGDNTTRMTCNDEVKNMAHLVSCPYIDLFQDTCINAYNRTLYSYDGGNHMNQLGNQIVGLAHRKAIIGI